jgi:arginine exporter protein ArgO
MLENIKSFLLRNGLWVSLGIIAFAILNPGMTEIRTLLFLILIEILALGLASLSTFIYTKLDFIKEQSVQTLGLIFLGVHFLIGLSVIGIYYVI